MNLLMMKRLAKKLGGIAILYYVLVYFVLILIFSFIYYFLPAKSFYHTTSKYEYSELTEEADIILEKIKEHIFLSNLNYYGDTVINLNGWAINLSELRAYSLNVADFPNNISFRLGITFLHENGIQSGMSPEIKIDIQEKIKSQDLVLCSVRTDSKPISLIDSLKTPEISNLFKIPSDNGLQVLSPMIVLSSEVWNDIIYFGQSYRGFPNKKINGQWLRMVYLSSGIATSTLIGDIVPITKLSRFLITVQGLLTILVISLFFNALANDIAEGMEKKSKKKKNK
jgi:hypothetical protein